MVLIFLPLTLYLIDVYTVYSASVLAASSVLRSLFGVGKLRVIGRSPAASLTAAFTFAVSLSALYDLHVSGPGCTLGFSSEQSQT